MQFDALPKVPVIVLFNDADDEFPTQCSLLFERRAESYLDAECLAMIARLLLANLKRAARKGNHLQARRYEGKTADPLMAHSYNPPLSCGGV